MNPLELTQACVDAINKRGDDAELGLTFPKGVKVPKRWPRMALACENVRGDRVYYVPARNMLRHLARNGLVEFVDAEGNPR